MRESRIIGSITFSEARDQQKNIRCVVLCINIYKVKYIETKLPVSQKICICLKTNIRALLTRNGRADSVSKYILRIPMRVVKGDWNRAIFRNNR